MAERFTKRDELGNAYIIGVNASELLGNLEFMVLNQVSNALNKLAHYEDLEGQFRLVVLPCAVGTPIWYLGSDINNETCEREYFIGICSFKLFMLDKLGEKFFLTKEAALDKLKELRGEE